MGTIAKRQTLAEAVRNKMLWRAVIAHVLKGNIEEKSLEISMSRYSRKIRDVLGA